MKLFYKTLGDAIPDRKPKIFFACHPDDFHTYFKPISDMILSMYNCVFWYRKEKDGFTQADEDDSFTIRQMQLIIVPVTLRLLKEPNQAIDKDIPQALASRVPILPLKQEDVPDELYAERFGSLHYLDSYSDEVTAIAFSEKLRRYLDTVLIRDELAQKIRSAFDAYIFLSYRKKDRRFAQQLMKLIHDIPYCRDIAIWYDEFLTPGEDFNSIIEQSLRDSDLVAMVVTPNLVNEENYVRSVEYPMAVEEHKPVLPIEMTPTDRDDLARLYQGIAACIPGSDVQRFHEEFLSAVKAVAIRTNDTSPEHQYLIGLAYLNGIDVEVDRERAVELITAAADSGCLEAYEKLVFMYVNGEGVASDPAKGLALQRTLTDKLGQRRKSEPDEPNSFEYLKNLLKLGEIALLAGDSPLSQEYYSHAFEVGDAFVEQFHTDRIYRVQYLTLKGLGENAVSKKDYAAAERPYLDAMSRCMNFAEVINEPFAWRDLGDICQGLGFVYDKLENSKGSKTFIRSVLWPMKMS